MNLDAITRKAADRRSFLKGAGLTGMGLAGAAVLGTNFGGNEQKVEAAASITDLDIGNFALNLEYLEAEFYCVSTYGANLVQLGIISANDQTGPTTGGKMVPGFAKMNEAYVATKLRTDEITHVKLLRKFLDTDAVKKPAINLDALGYGFKNIYEWLKLARQFEDVGVSAYLGAATLLSQKDYVAMAAGISVAEAEHAGYLRLLCIMNGVVSPAVDSLDIPPSPSMPFNLDGNSFGIARTTSQVLNVLYQGGRCAGGFFPDGLNGNIVCQG
jgi:hypothetical protein